MSQTITILLLLATLASAVVENHVPPERTDDRMETLYYYLPSPDLLRHSKYRWFLADLYLIRTQNLLFEDKERRHLGYVERLTELIVDIDPDYRRIYFFGAIAFSSLYGADGARQADRLLEKGERHFPDDYKYPYYRGLNRFLNLNDIDGAVEQLRAAARRPDAPQRVIWLADSLLQKKDGNDQQRSYEHSIQFLEEQYRETTDPTLRETIGRRIEKLRIVQQLNRLAADYIAKTGQPPFMPDDLVRAGLLDRVPDHPFGSTFIYYKELGRFE